MGVLSVRSDFSIPFVPDLASFYPGVGDQDCQVIVIFCQLSGEIEENYACKRNRIEK